MGRIRRLRISNYRSVRDEVTINFPEGLPLVLIGENNAGKSNIVRALDLLLGESWPGNHEPEDHEYFDRDRANCPIEIGCDLTGVTELYQGSTRMISGLTWSFASNVDRPLQMIFPNGGASPYVSNDVRGQCMCVVVGADRRLSYQLGYATKYTFLSRLMRRFHDRLMADPNRVQRLEVIFGNLKATFEEVQEFAVFTKELRSQVAELSGNLAYGLGIDFSAYNPSNYFRALRIQPEEQGQVREFEELGTGQEQILALSFAYAYARAFHDADGLVLVIEEPEAHLHPLAQEWVAKKIRELASGGLQIVITTHSPAFIDVLGLEGVAVVRKADGATQVTQLTRADLARSCNEAGAAAATDENILPFYSAAATEETLAGFFARRIVLVEGSTEALALPVYLERVGLLAAKEGVAIIPVAGVGNLAKWWRLFRAYGIPVYVIFDNDAADGEDADGQRRSDVLSAIGLKADRITEIMQATEWIIEGDFSVFGLNFEESLRGFFGEEYAQLENEARSQFRLTGDRAKPLVARYVAEKIDLDHHPAVKERFEELAERVRGVFA